MENRATALLAFAAGVTVGVTWPRTRKYVVPYFRLANKGIPATASWAVYLCFSQKERLEDIVAKAKGRKAKAPERGPAEQEGEMPERKCHPPNHWSPTSKRSLPAEDPV